MKPWIEIVHHACQAGNYKVAWQFAKLVGITSFEGKVSISKLGDWQKMLEILLEFFPDCDTTQEPPLTNTTDKCTIIFHTALSLFSMGNLNEAEMLLIKLLAIDEPKQNYYLNLSRLYAYQGRLDKSVEMARQAVNKSETGFAHCYLAWTEFLLGNLSNAEEDFERCDRLSTRQTLVWYADYLKRKKSKKYTPQLFEKNILKNKCNCKNFIISYQCIFGDIYTGLGSYDFALDYYNNAIQTSREITTAKPILIDALLGRGRLTARYMKTTEETFSDLYESLDFAISGGYRIYEADIRVGLAWAYIAEGDIQSARAEAEHALKMSRNMGYHWGEVDAEEVLSKLNITEDETK